MALPWLLALLFAEALASGRPCSHAHFRYKFGVCNSLGQRNIYSYVPPGFGATGLATGQLVLAKAGGCSVKQKADGAAAAGAEALVLIGEAANDAGPQVVTIPEDEDGDVLWSAAAKWPVMANFSCAKENSTQGCEQWVPDPSGRFVHSGNNSGFHDILSTLTLSANFVRDGYVIFRYAVDSERNFDGLYFEMDWNNILQRASAQGEYKDVRVNVSKGHHTLRWQYSKDLSKNGGQDRAWIQMLEAVGTEYADLECLPCRSSRLHSTVGATHCNACGRDTYLHRDTDTSPARCVNCSAGRWAVEGSVGPEACKQRPACQEGDAEIHFTPCRSNTRKKRREWREPVVCNPALPASVSLGATEDSPCEPCQPREWRPDGGDCVPKFPTCPPGKFALQEACVGHWHSWPRNFSRTFQSLQPEEPQPHSEPGWQLEPSGAFAYVEGTGQQGEAFLNFGVNVYSSRGQAATVRFICEVEPAEAWGQEARFLVDGNVPEGLSAQRQGTRFVVQADLAEGARQLSWALLRPGRGQSFRLHNITVSQAESGGSTVCLDCPAGFEVQGHRCKQCPAGKASRESRCNFCPVDHFSGPGASSCQPCGEGLSSVEGAAACDLPESLGNAEGLSFSLSALASAWSAAKIQGPLSVAGDARHFVLQPFAATAVAEAEGSAFIWEMEQDECEDSGAKSPVGSRIVSVRPALEPRGVVLEYVGQEQCESRPRGATLTFRCDPTATPATAGLEFGVGYLPRLRLAGPQGCNISLEWTTAAACPPCRLADFAPQPGSCQADGHRRVVFTRVGQCLGGVEAPSEMRERCGRGNSRVFLQALVAAAALLSGCCSCYACYLHRKYAKYVQLQ